MMLRKLQRKYSNASFDLTRSGSARGRRLKQARRSSGGCTCWEREPAEIMFLERRTESNNHANF